MLTWATHHRALVLGMLCAVLVTFTAVGVGVWFFVLRSPATQVNLREALRLYQQQQRGRGRSGGSTLPPSGVYRYRTAGGEQLSVGDISRTFPPATNMIVTDGKCASMEWEPLEQHVEGLKECPSANGAVNIATASSYEEIAGTRTTSVIRCPARTYLVPPDPTVGERWRTTCHSTDEKVVFSGRVIGSASVLVQGRTIPALHTSLTLAFSGAQSGTNPNEYWISVRNGLVLRQRESVDVSEAAGPLGSVRYTEHMAIALASLSPIR